MYEQQGLELVGSRIRAVRISRGMSQADLAVEASVSLPLISNIERGKTGMQLETFVKVAEAETCAYLPAYVQRAEGADHSVLLLRDITRKVDSVLDGIGNADLTAASAEELGQFSGRERTLGVGRYAHAGVKQRRERGGDSLVVLILQNTDECNAFSVGEIVLQALAQSGGALRIVTSVEHEPWIVRVQNLKPRRPRNRPQVNLLTCGLLLFDIQLIK